MFRFVEILVRGFGASFWVYDSVHPYSTGLNVELLPFPMYKVHCCTTLKPKPRIKALLQHSTLSLKNFFLQLFLGGLVSNRLDVNPNENYKQACKPQLKPVALASYPLPLHKQTNDNALLLATEKANTDLPLLEIFCNTAQTGF